MRADRLSEYENLGRAQSEALVREFERGSQVVHEGRLGADRFAKGEGRHGAF
jgi:enoyl-CoA hydratase